MAPFIEKKLTTTWITKLVSTFMYEKDFNTDNMARLGETDQPDFLQNIICI